MTTYVALLRGINVGGHKPVGMADLRDLLARLGFDEPQSLLQSGNLVFRSGTRAGTQLERLLESETRKQLALETAFYVRTAKEWKALVSGNPFRAEAERDPGHLVVMCFKDAPAAPGVKALQRAITGREVVRIKGRQGYILYPDGQGRSRLTTAMIDKHLGRGTGRNWNTVLKVAGLVNPR